MAEDASVPGLLGGGDAPAPLHHGQAAAVGCSPGSVTWPRASSAAREPHSLRGSARLPHLLILFYFILLIL